MEIKEDHPDKPRYQRHKALCIWQWKNGDSCTYKALIHVPALFFSSSASGSCRESGQDANFTRRIQGRDRSRRHVTTYRNSSLILLAMHNTHLVISGQQYRQIRPDVGCTLTLNFTNLPGVNSVPIKSHVRAHHQKLFLLGKFLAAKRDEERGRWLFLKEWLILEKRHSVGI